MKLTLIHYGTQSHAERILDGADPSSDGAFRHVRHNGRVTDPSTGAPLTRRAARAAADAARAGASAPAAAPSTPEGVSEPTRSQVSAPTVVHAQDAHPSSAATAPLSVDDPFIVDSAPARTRRRDPAPPARTTGGDADILNDAVDEVRTSAMRRARRIRGIFTIVAAASLLVGGTIAVTAAAMARTGTPVATAAASVSHSPSASAVPVAAPVSPPASTDLCGNAAVTAALSAHDTEAVVAAAGGGAKFREAVVSGAAPCVHLDDPQFTWVVVNKKRPFQPKDYAPTPLTMPTSVRDLGRQPLRADAAAGLTKLIAAAKQAGAGEIAVNSGYRSYQTQISNYGVQVRSRGVANADLVSARPGFSEHQSGLATDVEPCGGNGRCGNLDALAGTPQDRFIIDHAWEYGYIVRYEAGRTPITGYAAEPWHLRFIGVGLAKAYHDGGFHTLEEFFDLPAAPTY